MRERFNADYFERGEETGVSCYTAFRWLPELTIPMAHELVTHLQIDRHESILDFGCAKGFLVRALRMLRYNAYGFDVSQYAIDHAPEDTLPFLFCGEQLPVGKYYSWLISKDVLEHVPYEKLHETLVSMRIASRNAFVIVPLGDGHRYNAAEYEKDATHIIRQPPGWWGSQFWKAGFETLEMDTDLPFIKKSRCRMSDGFFTLRRRV